jgi:hypothetical protein
MSVSYNDGLTQAWVFLREDAKRLKANDWLVIAEQSRQHISRDRPREVIADITGNGTKTYTLGSGTTALWVNRFSKIRTVEYPIGSDPVAVLQSDSWFLYRSATDTEQLKFKNDSPGASETFRILFTTRHAFDPTSSSIDDEDKAIIGLLLGHYGALALVSDFLKPNRSNLPNDSVDFSQKATDMMTLAKELLDKYAKLVSGKSAEVKTYATLVKDFDMISSQGEDYILNPTRYR